MTSLLFLVLATTPAADPKIQILIISAEDEYRTEKTLPAFVQKYLPECQSSLVVADPANPHHLPGLAKIKDADVVILSVRRRPLMEVDAKIFKEYVAAKKPLVAIRTSSHAFSPKKGEKLPPGVTPWESFDHDVLGCHYTGHYPNTEKTHVDRPADLNDHQLLAGVAKESFVSPSWLYKSSPLAKNCTAILTGTAGKNPKEPVAWIREPSASHGKVFYTSLGHPGDFEIPAFATLLKNAVKWATAPP